MDDLSNDDERNIPVWAYETIEIEDPDPDWMDQGIRERKELLQILSAWGVREVEHIGSTAIPDLPAKPIIDFMASISSFEEIDGVVGNLSLYDWHYVPPELDKHHWRRFFVKVESEGSSFTSHARRRRAVGGTTTISKSIAGGWTSCGSICCT